MSYATAKAHTMLNFINRCAEYICHIIVVTMVVLIFINVVMRYLFSQPISWSEEIALLLLVWFAMLSIATGLYRNSHMVIGVIVDRLRPALRNLFLVISHALIAVLAFNMCLNAGILVQFIGGEVLPASGLSRSWIYLAALVGSGLLGVNALAGILLAPSKSEADRASSAIAGE